MASTTLTITQAILDWALFGFLLAWMVTFAVLALRSKSYRRIEVSRTTHTGSLFPCHYGFNVAAYVNYPARTSSEPWHLRRNGPCFHCLICEMKERCKKRKLLAALFHFTTEHFHRDVQVETVLCH